MDIIHYVVKGDLRIIKKLIRLGTNLNRTDPSPLAIAADANKWGVVEYLIQMGAQADILTNDQQLTLLQHIQNSENAFFDVITMNNYSLLKKYIENFDINNQKNMPATILEEIKIKNISLSRDVELLLQEVIIEFRFSPDEKSKNNIQDSLFDEINERMLIICHLISHIHEKHAKSDSCIPDEKFVLIGRTIAQHINIVKQLFRVSYIYLPWDEMEFCLCIFLSTILEPKTTDIVYKLVLDQYRIIGHLTNFEKNLSKVQKNFKEDDLNSKKNVPNWNKRAKDIVAEDDEFEKLYDDFIIIKNVYSLNRINGYLKLSISVDLGKNENIGKMTIVRTLQVIGEFLNNKKPNVCDTVHKLLIAQGPMNLLEVIKTIRDTISHIFGLEKKVELEETFNFRIIQQELRKLEHEMSYVLYKMKIEAAKSFLKKVINSTNLKHIKEITTKAYAFNMDEIEVQVYETQNFKKISELVEELSLAIPNQNEDMQMLFSVIRNLIEKNASKVKTLGNIYHSNIFKGIWIFMGKHCNSLNSAKESAKSILDSLTPETVHHQLKRIVSIVNNIINYKIKDEEISKNVSLIRNKIYFAIEFELNRVKEIEVFKEKLDDNAEDIAGRIFSAIKSKIKDENKEEYRNLLERKKQMNTIKKELRELLSNNDDHFEEKVKDLGDADRKKLMSFYEKNDLTKCRKCINILNDPYEQFITKIRKEELTLFSGNKLKKDVESVLSNKKEFKIAVSEFIKESEEQVFIYYQNRLKLLNEVTQREDLVYNKELQATTEMLLIDLLEILKYLDMCPQNIHYVEECCPLLVGRNMRNYLAHGDILVDILPLNPVISTISNALKLIKEGTDLIEKKNIAIGAHCCTVDYKLRYSKNLQIVEEMRKNFIAAESGNTNKIWDVIVEKRNMKAKDNVGNTLLHYAAHSNDAQTFKLLLNHINMHISNELNETPLQMVAKYGSNNILNYLVQSGLDINTQDLLFYAVKFEQEAVVRTLLKLGADVNARYASENTLLHYAATNNNKCNILIELCKMGAVMDEKNEDHFTPLHGAAIKGNCEGVQYLLNGGANINARNKEGMTPLHAAMWYTHKDVVMMLLKHKKINVNAVDCEARSALHIAARSKENCVVVSELLARKANVEAKCIGEETPLSIACGAGCGNIIELLLKSGASVNSHNTLTGTTPLYIASSRGYSDLADFLLKNGANINVSTFYNDHTPLHTAVCNGHEYTVKVLLQHDPILEAHDSPMHCTPLHYAAFGGHTAITKVLLGHGAAINALNAYRHTPLYTAALIGYENVVELLLNYKTQSANIEITARFNRTPLHAACFNGHAEIVRKLLEHGAQADAADQFGDTPLHVAAEHGRADICKLLIQKNPIIIEMRSNMGYTALHLAAKHGHEKPIITLLEKKANINCRCDEEWTPLHLASAQGHSNIARILLKNNANPKARNKRGNTPHHLAAMLGHKNILEVLPYKEIECSTNCLHYAAQFGHMGCLQVLLDKGLYVDMKNEDDCTPLHIASFFGRNDHIRFLLHYKADINAKTEEGLTPLHMAILNGHLLAVQILLENSADISATTRDLNDTVLHMAVEKNCYEIVEMLLNYGANFLAINKHATVLHYAVNSKNEIILKLLLNKIQDKFRDSPKEIEQWLNAPDGDGDTPLMWAIEAGHANLTQLLLDYGADIEAIEARNYFNLL